ncbi:MAG: AMP-binding protein [Actinomycetota bacterium]
MLEPRSRVFHEILSQRAEETPDKPFLVTHGRSVTYLEADCASNSVAHALRAEGIHAGDRVALMLPSGIDFIIYWLGICKVGAMPVPFNEAYLGQMLARQAVEVEAKTALIARKYLSRWADVSAQLESLDSVYIFEDGAGTDLPDLPANWRMHPAEKLYENSTDALAPVASYCDTMAILYTSGTTGASKGVMYGYGHAYATARPLALMCKPDDIFYMFLPMFHTGLPHVLGTVLISGSTMAIREKFSRTRFWSDVRAFNATVTLLISTMTSYLLSNPPSGEDTGHSLERVFMAPLHPDLKHFKERFGCHQVATLFNMTEAATPLITGFDTDDPSTCGRARPGIVARLVDEHDEPVPVGTVGELVLRAEEPWEMNLGYWRNAEATAHAWRNQWLHTGDLLSCDADGNFRFHDRLKDVIRRRGENVSAYELELFVNDHPQVEESAAVAVKSEMGDDEIKIVVRRSANSGLEAGALARYLEERLPAYMVPRFIRVQDQELEKTPTGKITKVGLQAEGRNSCWDREARSSFSAAGKAVFP